MDLRNVYAHLSFGRVLPKKVQPVNEDSKKSAFKMKFNGALTTFHLHFKCPFSCLNCLT